METMPPKNETRKPQCWLRDDCRDLYINQLLRDRATRIGKRARVIRFSLNHAWTLKSQRCQNAQFLQFGVHEGKDICRMAAFLLQKDVESKKTCSVNGVSTVIHGFDSFVGLPEQWENGQEREDGTPLFQAGAFDVDGQAPKMSALWTNLNLKTKSTASSNDKSRTLTRDSTTYPDMVHFHKGWFCDTVPHFFDSNTQPVAFVHADADLYSSTITFLSELCERRLLRKGSVITFDEFWNYENWQQGEYKAWMEVVGRYELQYRYLCYHAPSEHDKNNLNWYGYQSVGIEILKDT